MFKNMVGVLKNKQKKSKNKTTNTYILEGRPTRPFEKRKKKNTLQILWRRKDSIGVNRVKENIMHFLYT